MPLLPFDLGFGGSIRRLVLRPYRDSEPRGLPLHRTDDMPHGRRVVSGYASRMSVRGMDASLGGGGGETNVGIAVW